MRIAVVHSFYSSDQPSGENRVVEDQVSALRGAGHEVLVLGLHTDEIAQTPFYALRAAVWVTSGRGPDPSGRLVEFSPDVVHIHNLFPNIGTSWVDRWQGPVVVSLHNYRFACANGFFYRDGAMCFECPNHGNVRAIQHACYRGSRLATVPLALSRSADQNRVLKRADAIVTTTEASDAAIRQILGNDLPLRLIPNFGPDSERTVLPYKDRERWVAVGRFSPEKGFLELLRSWPWATPLDVIGNGDLADSVRRLAGPQVRVLQGMPISDLRDRLPRYLGMIFPSRWLEIAPQVVVEAMRVGLPVVAFEDNGVSSFVEASETGTSYGGSRSIENALARIEADGDGFSRRAADYFQKHWRREIWLKSMTGLYEELMGSRG